MTDHDAGGGKQCFVPLVEDRNANMRLLHLGTPTTPPWLHTPRPPTLLTCPQNCPLALGALVDLHVL